MPAAFARSCEIKIDELHGGQWRVAEACGKNVSGDPALKR